MRLSHDQRLHLFRHGYVRVPGVAPRTMVDAALRRINNSLGERGMPPDQLPTFRARSFCPELCKDPAILDLYLRTPLEDLCVSAIGPLRPPTMGQIALRFPALDDPPRPPGPHIDGMYTPQNGVAAGTVENFAALACMLLSDLSGGGAGNFTVWPGSHLRLAAHFRAHGPESLLRGMPALDLGEPLALTGAAGDAVIAHYLLAHAVGPNVSPHVRYACFYRLHAVAHDGAGMWPMTDPWLGWRGMQDLVAAEPRT